MGEERRRLLVIVLAVLAFLSIASYSLLGEEKSPALVPGEEDAASPPEKNRPIPGQEQAVSRDALGDPFDMLHGKREAAAPLPQEEGAHSPETPSAAPLTATPPAAAKAEQEPAPKAPAAVPVLRGLVRSDAGAMAILSVGGASGPVAVGETLAGVTVERIEENGVLVRGASGEQYLPLAR